MTKHIEDEELLNMLADSNSRQYAFSLLVNKYSKKLYLVIRRLVITHDDTDDVLQNTWLQVHRFLEGYRQNSSLYTWLYRIAVNESLAHLKKEKRKRIFSSKPFDEDLKNAISSGVDIDADVLEKKLQIAIISLPEKQRAVFQMRYFDEMPFQQISEIMGTSVGALKANYHYAAKKIEEYMLA